MKGKGDDFFRSGDFRSAINAYSSAFESHDKKSEISKAALSALANRAACYLKIGEPARTIADVDDALRLSSNAQNLDLPGGLNGFWLKCFVRRGTGERRIEQRIVKKKTSNRSGISAVLLTPSSHSQRAVNLATSTTAEMTTRGRTTSTTPMKA